MNLWILLRLALGIGLVISSMGTALALESTSGSDPSRFQELIDKAREEGEIPIIVKLRDVADQGAVINLVDDLDATVTTRYKIFALLAMVSGPQALEALAGSPRVVNVIEDVPQPPTLDDTIPLINADTVHGLGWTGSGYTVAILDTGIDAGHPFLTGRIVEEACYSSDGGIRTTLCPDGSTDQEGAGSADATIADCVNAAGNNICDHGSHVAGIAAGAASGAFGEPGDGVAPGADIIAIQVFHRIDDDPDNDNTPCAGFNRPSPCVLTSAENQIKGLERVAELSDDMDIAAANMSLGGGENESACDDDPRKEAVDALLALGIATVIASGNSGFLNAVGAPGCISTAVTVGSTTNADNVSSFSNRGPLLDLFAPGSSVDSAVIGATDFDSKNGTSMAAPHVAGAFAVLREAYPSADVATLLTYMQDTGVPITYDIDDDGDDQETTPRLNLLAALQEGNDPPELTVDDDPVTVDEGDTATNTGTFSDPEGDPVTLEASVGTVNDDGGGDWSWSFDTRDGPDESQTVTISGTDDKGETGDVTFELVVQNVDPTVEIQDDQVEVIDEGDTVTVVASYTDPGWEDTHTVEIDWGHDDLDAAATLVADPVGPPLASGTVTASEQYGDNGTFTVVVTVTDKDDGVGSDEFELTVNNVDPTAEIDLTDATDVNGEQTILSEAGTSTTFTGRSTDPGSDDLTLLWDWGDGSTDDTLYRVNPPNNDPPLSPSVQPRDVTEDIDHTFADACLYVIGFSAEDDDDGVSPVDTATVIIVGNADLARSAGYWQHQYRGNGRIDFSEERLECYLAIARHMSAVFDEERALGSIDAAHEVLFVAGNSGSMEQLLDRQILTAWLNFANGAIGYDELVDTTGDGVGDTEFSDVITNAENVRLDPSSTRAQLEAQKDILERINGS